MSDVEDAQAALDGAARTLALTTESVEREMAWDEYQYDRDAYGDARELRGHVGACRVWRIPNQSWETVGQAKCGDGWYCPDAPAKEPVKAEGG